MIKDVAWKMLKDISGWNDIVDCFTKGDIWVCGGLVMNLVPWGKVGKVLEAGYKAVRATVTMAKVISKAQGLLRRATMLWHSENLRERPSGQVSSRMRFIHQGTLRVPSADALFRAEETHSEMIVNFADIRQAEVLLASVVRFKFDCETESDLFIGSPVHAAALKALLTPW